MSEDQKTDTEETSEASAAEGSDEQQSTAQNGPTFTEGPDPLAGVKKGASDVLDSMEGKTVSMKTYVGTIIGVIVLMLLARCGG
jgi:hypothetical protein